jgi:hypothetical protein
VFLAGGPGFAGTTLFALLLNGPETVCLDEPDFHHPEHSARGIPFLERQFPDVRFPARPDHTLDWDEATALIAGCAAALAPLELGIKTNDWTFAHYVEPFRRRGAPVVAIVRDIRDALVRPLPDWIDEAGLNERYRLIWRLRNRIDAVVRYEDLVLDPERALEPVARALGRRLDPRPSWSAEDVHAPMLKLDRHALLTSGSVTTERVGLWREDPSLFSAESHETARLMGYPPT